jgi:hypothetical protein
MLSHPNVGQFGPILINNFIILERENNSIDLRNEHCLFFNFVLKWRLSELGEKHIV